MQDFAVTLYAATVPGGSLPMRAHFAGASLVLSGQVSLRVPAQMISVRRGGFDDDGLLLDWEGEGQAYSVVPVDAAATQGLLASAPPELQAQLQKWRGQVRVQHFKWRAAVTAVVVVALGALLLFWQSERVAGWLAERVTPSQEKRLGEMALTQLTAEGGKLTQEGPAAEAIKSIGTRLTAGSRYQYQWHVLEDPSVNAMALPGGMVVVHSGLIAKVESAEELAGVLAHEVQHVENRHGLQQMIHSAGWAALLAVTLGDVSAITAIAIHQVGNLRHSRRLESQADEQGVAALVKAGIEPSGMATFFKRMKKEEKGMEYIQFLSTHPASADRLEAIEELAKKHPCGNCTPLAFDWAAIQASVKKDADPEKKPQ